MTKIAAFTETTYMDCMTADDKIRREEWRVRKYKPAMDDALAEAFGPDWRRYKPLPKYVVEHRYLRRMADSSPYVQGPGKYQEADSRWEPFGIYGTRQMALSDLPDDVVAIDHGLQTLQSIRRNRAAKLAAERKAEETALAEAKERKRRKSQSAETYRRIIQKDPDLHGQWNRAVLKLRDNDKAKADEGFRDLVIRAQSETKIPQRRKAIKQVIAYAERCAS